MPTIIQETSRVIKTFNAAQHLTIITNIETSTLNHYGSHDYNAIMTCMYIIPYQEESTPNIHCFQLPLFFIATS